MTTGRTSRGTGRLAATATAVVVVAGGLAGTAIPASAATASPGHTAYARAGRAPATHRLSRTGTPAASATVTGAVAIKARDPRALAAAAAAVSTPRSSTFHHYLAKGAFAAAYGPSAATVEGVEAALRAGHLTVTSVSANRTLVRFRGSVAHTESAFRTSLATFRTANGHTGTETTSAPAFPSTVASQVAGVIGLNTVLTAQHAAVTVTHPSPMSGSAPAVTHYPGAPSPCAKATSTAKTEDGLTFDQVAHAYGVDGLYKAGDLGAGQTIAVYEAEPYRASDVAAFDSCYFGSSQAAAMTSRLHMITVDGGEGTAPSPYGTDEADLDVEDVSAIAPKATIDVYEGPNTVPGSLDTMNAMVTDDTAHVMSTSYSYGCEADVQAFLPNYQDIENQIFEQAALQGQTQFAASGDSGSDGCAPNGGGSPQAPDLSVSDPANLPFVTAVGGTAVQDATQPATETVWNDGNLGGGGGGGVSNAFGSPSWQTGAVSTADKAALTQAYAAGADKCPEAVDGTGLCREVPDVSALASPNTGGIGIYDADYGGWVDFGGTSSSAPLWAAMIADVDASAGCTASSAVGFASPALYAVAASPTSYAAAFNDITAGNNDIYDVSNGKDFAALPGYDMATGLGSPVLTHTSGSAGLAAYLCSATPSAQPTVTSINPISQPLTGGGTVTVTGNGFTGAKAVSVGNVDIGAGHFVVVDNSTITFTAPAAAGQTGQVGSDSGAGRALVSVTGSNGSSSPVHASSSLYYVDTAAGKSIPSVIGVASTAGAQAGGGGVTVYGSDFATGGSDATTGVSFGGVAAPSFQVLSPTELHAVVPAYKAGTTVCHTGDQPTTDDCQVQVVVSNANGSSATSRIEPFSFDGCPTCETYQAPSEYDYLAKPVITSVSPGYISEAGTSIVTITGTGLGAEGVDWVDFGPSSRAASQDFSILSDTPSEIQVQANPHDPTVEPVGVAVSVKTEAGHSNSSTATYAGIPDVTGVSPPAAPDTGGTALTVTGHGFHGSGPADGGEIQYAYAENPDFTTTQLSGYSTASDTSIAATSPSIVPGPWVVTVCTVTACSAPETESEFDHSIVTFYRPGNPSVSGVSPSRGPASGGTKVVITGDNLDNVVAVDFGSVRSPDVENAGDGLDSYEVDAVAPPGKPGTTVAVTVITVESRNGGKPSAVTGKSRFTYTPSAPSPPRAVHAHVHGTRAKVSWSKPAQDGGSPITRYRAVARAFKGQHGHHTPKDVVVGTTKSGRSAMLRGLKGGWEYEIYVRAISKRGNSPAGKAPETYFIHEPH